MAQSATVEKLAAWGIAPDGTAVECYRLANDVLSLELVTYGARVTEMTVPDRAGNLANIVLGHAALTPYLTDEAYLGCTVGRYANRIAKGRFQLGGRHVQLDVNAPPNTLHGGAGSLAHRNWRARPQDGGVRFEIASADGDQGFPGTLTVRADYLLHGNQVTLTYEATCDQETVLNLTNHAYFNLAGEGSGTVLDHEVQLASDAFLPIDPGAIPLGQPIAVEGTPFDFRTPHTLGERIHEPDVQLVNARGYDHNFVLQEGRGVQQAATLVDPASGRRLQVATDQPGIQLYSGNYLDGTVVGRGGRPYLWRSAVCLETQHWPDSPNHPEYPSTMLRPGELFCSHTVWTFDVV